MRIFSKIKTISLIFTLVVGVLAKRPPFNKLVVDVDKEFKLDNNSYVNLKLAEENSVGERTNNHLIFQYKVLRSDIVNIKIIDPELSTEELDKDLFKNDYGTVDLSGFSLEYEKSPFSFKLVRKDTKEQILSTDHSEITVEKRLVEYTTDRSSYNSNIFGLGERNTQDFKLKDGVYTIWNFDQSEEFDRRSGDGNTYGSHPVYLQRENSTKFHICFFKNSHAMDVRISGSKIKFQAIGGAIDLVIFIGDQYADSVVKAYHEYIGGHALPPFWAFGFHQSRYGWKNYREVVDVISNYNYNRIPLEVIWSDIDIYEDSKVFTINQNTYPMVQFSNFIKDFGLKYVVIVDPAISIDDSLKAMKTGMEMDVFLRSPNTGFYFVGKVWPGLCVFPDWIHPNIKNFWKELLDDFRKTVPFNGIWVDMNEPTNFCGKECQYYPQNKWTQKAEFKASSETLDFFPGQRDPAYNTITLETKHFNGKSEYLLHNLYGYYHSKATYEYLKNSGSSLPFVLTRSTFVGSGKYAAHWSGDNKSDFTFMKMSVIALLNFNLFGIPMMGSDICGFFNNAWDSLCARWIQLGALYPFSRNHNYFESVNQDFSSFGKRVINVAKKSLNLRYAIIKHYYSLFIETRGTGTIVRPLFFEFPEDEDVFSEEILNKQFLIGKWLMATPVLEDVTQSTYVYFPAGKWYELFSEMLVSANPSGKMIFLKNEMYEAPPLYLREGGVIGMQNSEEVIRLSKLGNLFTLKAVLKEQANLTNKTFTAGGMILGIHDLDESNVKAKCIDDNKTCLTYINMSVTVKASNSCSLAVKFDHKISSSDQDHVLLDKLVLLNFPQECKGAFLNEYCLLEIEGNVFKKVCKIEISNKSALKGEVEDAKLEIKLYLLSLKGLNSIKLFEQRI